MRGLDDMQANKGNVLIYRTVDNKVSVDALLFDESVWLSLEQMAELFERDKSTVSRHEDFAKL